MKSTYTGLKIISIVLFSFISIAIILIAKNTVTRYELSIYTSMPSSFWILLTTIIMGGIGIVIYQIKEKNGWQIGLLLVLLGNLIIVLLPYLRGYIFPCSGDHLTHLGYVKDILQTGKFSLSNVYPVTHILIAQLSFIFDISPEIIINFAGPLFYLLLILFIYNLSNEIFVKPVSILATITSTVLFSYYYNQVFPMGFAFITFSLVFHLYYKYLKIRKVSLGILLIIMVVLLAFFHPVASFLLTVALLMMEFSKLLANKFYIKEGINIAASWTQQISLALPLISFIVLMLWVWKNYSVWNSSVRSVVSWFRLELLVKPMTEIAAESFDKLGLGIWGILELFVRIYGHYFIYTLLSTTAIIMLVRRKLKLTNINLYIIALYSLWFCVVTFVCFIDFVKPLTTLSSGRIMHLMPVLFPPLVGLTLYEILESKHDKGGSTSDLQWRLRNNSSWRSAVVWLIISFCSIIGIFALYPSPYIYQAYWGVDYAEFMGGRWLVEEGNPNSKALSLGTAPLYRYAHALLGTLRKNYPQQDEKEVVPDHFNYGQYATLGESFKGNRYMMSREKFIEIVYTELWDKLGRFNRNDFARLELDPSVDKLYSNEEMEVWYIHI